MSFASMLKEGVQRVAKGTICWAGSPRRRVTADGEELCCTNRYVSEVTEVSKGLVVSVLPQLHVVFPVRGSQLHARDRHPWLPVLGTRLRCCTRKRSVASLGLEHVSAKPL